MLSASSGLLLVGCGQMGGALLEGWYRQRETLCGDAWSSSVQVVESNPARRDAIATSFQLTSVASLDALKLNHPPALAVLAVKPQQLDETLQQLAPKISGAPVLSIAAGKTLDYYASHLSAGTPVIRAMPNIASTVGLGITYCLGNVQVSASTHALAEQLFSAVGSCHWLKAEEDFHAVTAFAGSGPAFVFYFMECLEQAARELGVAADLLRPTLIQLMQGSLAMAGPSADFAALRQSVASPGGTTQAGLTALMDGSSGLGSLLARTLQAAAKRSREMAE